jgi:hypothetical protein
MIKALVAQHCAATAGITRATAAHFQAKSIFGESTTTQDLILNGVNVAPVLKVLTAATQMLLAVYNMRFISNFIKSTAKYYERY